MFSLSGKMDFQIPCFPCAVATLKRRTDRGVSVLELRCPRWGEGVSHFIQLQRPPPPHFTRHCPPLYRALASPSPYWTLALTPIVQASHRSGNLTWDPPSKSPSLPFFILKPPHSGFSVIVFDLILLVLF